MVLSFRLIAVLGLLALVPPSASASEPGTTQQGKTTVDDQDAVTLGGLFDFQLPKLVWPKSLRFTLNPRWRDIIGKDVIRVRTGLRYAFNEKLEGSVEILPFIDNFSGDGEGGGGIAEYRVGAKLAWDSLLAPHADTAIGFLLSMPDGAAPEELTIGTAQLSSYFVFTRPWTDVAGLSSFLNVGFDVFDTDPEPGRIARWRPDRDFVSLTPGLIYHRAPFHYTLSVSVRTTVQDEARTFVSVKPVVSWEIPERYTLRLPGRWIAGVGWETIFYDDGIEHRLSGRLKWDFDVRRAVSNAMQRIR